VTQLSVTRVINASVLLELGGAAVLTDPYFDDHWFMRFREPIGLKAAELPRLSAILGCHGVFDHWQPRSLAAYPFKRETPCFVATRAMARAARAAGFEAVEVLEWGDERRLSAGLHLEVAPAQRVAGFKVNSYVLSAGGLRVFFGGEARDIEPLRRYRMSRPGVDLAFLPVDGSSLFCHRLVMDAEGALAAARVLGARALVPIHFAAKPLPPLLKTRSTIDDLMRLAPGASDLDVIRLETGVRWRHAAAPAE
jgi:L-ascorbate metabolism protein UlaG (beta-lactamase superfamily)